MKENAPRRWWSGVADNEYCLCASMRPGQLMHHFVGAFVCDIQQQLRVSGVFYRNLQMWAVLL